MISSGRGVIHRNATRLAGERGVEDDGLAKKFSG